MAVASWPACAVSTHAWAAPALLLASGACSRAAPPGQVTAHEAGAHALGREESAVPSVDARPGALEARGAGPSGAPFPEARVKLLDSGETPRRLLRYAWAASRHEQLTLDMRTSLAGAGGPGQTAHAPLPLPSVRVVVAIDPQTVSDDGALAYDWRVASASVTGDDRTVPQVADGMRAEVVAVEHLFGSGVVSSRGLGQALSVDPEQAADEVTSRPIALQVLETLWNVAAPFPDEEVGLGARWQRVSELAAKSARATQTDVFALVSLERSRGTLDDALSQTAPEQALSVPGMANGTRAQMGSMLASGAAKTRFDLSRLVPETRFQGTTTMVLASDDARGGGPPEPGTTMVLRVEIDLSGVVR